MGGEARNHHFGFGVNIDGLTMNAARVEGTVRVVGDPPLALVAPIGEQLVSGLCEVALLPTRANARADLGPALIACTESLAEQGYKDMVVTSNPEGIVPSLGIAGVTANWLRPSLIAAGYNPAQMDEGKKPDFGNAQDDAKAWKNVWSAEQGVGAVTAIEPTAQIVARLKMEYDAACALPRFDQGEKR
jgi:hypothetical protein